MRLKPILGWGMLLGVSLLPVLLLFLLGPRDFSSASHIMGQLAGLIGMTLFAITFVLSARLRFIEDLFNGLDKVYIVHRVFGATALMLLLFHPILLVLKFIPANLRLAAFYLLPGKHWSVNYGIIALFGMIVLVLLSFYGRIRYNRWKFSHEFMGAMFIAASLHIFLVRSQAARDFIFRGYYVYAALVSFIGLSAFLYSLFLRGKHYSYKVDSISLKSGVFWLALVPRGKEMRYHGGQFVFISFRTKGLSREAHPFSIASGSNERRIEIGIKSLGDFTSQMGLVKQGSIVDLEGPYGRFYKSRKKYDQVWIAGGIGITPFLGMIKDAKKKIDLFYTVKDDSEFIELENLQNAEKLSKGKFKLHLWVSNTQGFLSLKVIQKEIGDVQKKEFYICGPQALKNSITDSLIKMGISDIHQEEFNFK